MNSCNTQGGTQFLSLTFRCVTGNKLELVYWDSFDFVDIVRVEWTSGSYSCSSPFSISSSAATTFNQYYDWNCPGCSGFTEVTVTG